MVLDARFWVDVVQLLLTCGVGLYAWQASKYKATSDRLEEIRSGQEAQLKAHDVLLATLAEQIKNTPTDTAIHELALAIEHLVGDFKAHSAKLEGLHAIVQRLESITARQEDFLLNIGRK
ncbi:MAG: DUF2730 family protein [Kiloniellaceae bacterium]